MHVWIEKLPRKIKLIYWIKNTQKIIKNLNIWEDPKKKKNSMNFENV